MPDADFRTCESSFTTGIRTLDLALNHELERGKYILFCAPQGGGKTIMAAQIAGHAIKADQEVLLISTDVSEDEVYGRMASSFCNFDCGHPAGILGGIEFEEGFDDPSTKIPKLDRYGDTFAACFNQLRIGLDTHFLFRKVGSLTYDPAQFLKNLVDAYITKKGRAPDIVILDNIVEPPDRPGQNTDSWKLREAVLAASNAMKKLAADADLLSVAFCWADPTVTGDIDPNCIADYKAALAKSADAFIGISQRLAGKGEANRGGSSTNALRQNFYVQILKGEGHILPVNTNFRFQRCEDVSEGDSAPPPPSADSPASGLDSATAISAIIRKDPSYQGYILMSRQRFEELLELSNPNCINVYVLLLLSANYGRARPGSERGSSFWGRRAMGDTLGLTVKMIQVATQKLAKAGLITIDAELRDQPRGRSLSYHVTDWQGEQNPKEAKNYFKLFRNLLGSKKALTGNPTLLRLWLYCLTRARGFDDSAMQLKPGFLILDYDEIERRLRLNRSQADDLVKCLVDAERIGPSIGMDGQQELEVRNWTLYQKLVNPPTEPGVRKKGRGSGDLIEDELRAQAAKMVDDERLAVEKAGGKPAPNPGVL